MYFTIVCSSDLLNCYLGIVVLVLEVSGNELDRFNSTACFGCEAERKSSVWVSIGRLVIAC